MRSNYWVEGRTLFKKEKESSKMRMSGGSWTINLDEVKLENYDTIVYLTSEHKYSIDVKTVVEKGFRLNLKGENKLVVPLKNWVVK